MTNSQTNFVQELFCGWMSGISGTLVGQPFNTIKVRLQTQKSKHGRKRQTAMSALNKLIRKEGFMALYKGTMIPILGVGSFTAVKFSSFNFAKQHLQVRHPLLIPIENFRRRQRKLGCYIERWFCWPLLHSHCHPNRTQQYPNAGTKKILEEG